MSEAQSRSSPRWGNTTKALVSLVFIAVAAILLTYFSNLLGPLLVAFILSYLTYPVAGLISRRLKISWRLTVSLIFLLLLIALLGLIVLGGITLVTQLQSLLTFLQDFTADLPTWFEELSSRSISFMGFTFDMRTLDLSVLGQQVLSMIQPLFSEVGSLIGSVASSTAVTIGWIFFILLVSYFVLGESEGTLRGLPGLEIPGYAYDLQRLQTELSRIWNAFLRGYMLLFFITLAIYTVMLGLLGVRYYYALALVAGLALFIPYVGPGIAWLTYFIVCYFQGTTVFGLSSFMYALVIVGAALLVDNIMNSLVYPRIIADTLHVHPALLLVVTLVFASWLGVVGVVLAAPVLATIQLVGSYALNKLLDRNPWDFMQLSTAPNPQPVWVSANVTRRKILAWIRTTSSRLKKS